MDGWQRAVRAAVSWAQRRAAAVMAMAIASQGSRHTAARSPSCRCAATASDVVPIVSRAISPRVDARRSGAGTGRGGRRASRSPGARERRLFRWLARAGVDEATARERIYIAAVTRCYPGPEPERARRSRAVAGRAGGVFGVARRGAATHSAEARDSRRQAGDRAVSAEPAARPVDRPRARGDARRRTRRSSIPLPHPSGASSWIHQGESPGSCSSARSS